jgi:hypothetical protein
MIMNKYCSNNSQKILKDQKAAKFKHIILGYSNCFSLSWIDFVFWDDSLNLKKGQPRIPATILCAGDGSMYSPFQFDVSDPLIKSFSEMFGTKWFNFLANVNANMRNLIFQDRSSPRVFQTVIDYVDMMQSVGIGIGKSLPVGGVQLEVMMIPPKHSKDIFRPALFLRKAYEGNDDMTPVNEDEVLSDKNSLISPQNRLFLKQQKSCIEFSSSLLRNLLFTRKETSSYLKLKSWILAFFIFAEIALNLTIITIFASLWPVSFWIFMFIFPASNLLSPIFGIATLVLHSVVMARIFTLFNAFSLFNSLAALFCGLFGIYNGNYTLLYGLIIPLSLILCKLIISHLHLGYLPHLEYDKDMTLSRVDILRGEMSSHRSLLISD